MQIGIKTLKYPCIEKHNSVNNDSDDDNNDEDDDDGHDNDAYYGDE